MITDTTFFSTQSNYTIFIDSLTLDNVTISATTIEFTNISSFGSNFTNSNATFDAVANILNLAIGVTIQNVNTSINFTSIATNQSFNITFTSGQVLRTINLTSVVSVLNTAASCSEILAGFNAYFGFMPTVFIILGIITLVLLLFLLLFMVQRNVQGKSPDVNFLDNKIIPLFMGLGVLGLIGIILVIILAFLCTI